MKILRPLSKEEFVNKAKSDLDGIQTQELMPEPKYTPKEKSPRQKQDELYRSYAKERYTAYLRAQRNGHGRRALQ